MKDLARRLNFFATTFIGLLGLTLIYEVISENDPMDKLDDVLILLLGIVSIWWYKIKGYRSESAFSSIVILGLGLLFKVIGIFIEHADKEALGDDIGIAITLVLGFIFVTWQTLSHKKD